MFKRFVLAAVSVVAVLASPAMAETSVTTVALTGQTPNPSLVGQSVTLDVTVTQDGGSGDSCQGTADVIDTTGGGSIPVCTGVAINGAPPPNLATTGACSYAFPVAGSRTLEVAYSGYVGSGFQCLASNSTSSAIQTVSEGVPTLSEWGLWILAGAMLLAGAAVAARRSQRQQG